MECIVLYCMYCIYCFRAWFVVVVVVVITALFRSLERKKRERERERVCVCVDVPSLMVKFVCSGIDIVDRPCDTKFSFFSVKCV